MITCPNCKTELADGTKFCMLCGAPVEQPEAPVVQPEQNASLMEEAYETAPLMQDTYETAPVAQEEIPATPENKKQRKKIPVKFIAIGLAVLAVVVAAIIALFMIFGNNASKKSAVYMKDGKLYISLLDGEEPIKITSKAIDGWTTEYMSYLNYGMVQMSEDGKTIFYPENFDPNEYIFDLCYRSTTDPDADDVKIESEVSGYIVSKDAKLVLYQVKDELHIYNMKEDESDRIDKNVQNICKVSEDMKTVIYLTEDYDVYLWKDGEDAEKLESNVDEIAYITKDLSKVYYRKNDNLYVKEGTKDEAKIASDIGEVLQVYENGSIYYTKGETSVKTLLDFIEDDYAESDAAMVRPEWPSYYDYPWPEAPEYVYSWDYDTEEAYQQALAEYDLAYAAYEAEYARVLAQYEADEANYYVLEEAWDAKNERDYYRENAADYEINVSNITLYYYDGKESVEVATNLNGDMFSWGEWEYSDVEDTPVILFYISEDVEVQKVKIENIENLYDVYDDVEMSLMGEMAFAVAREDEMEVLEDGAYEHYGVLSGGKDIYYIKYESEEAAQDGLSGDLYVVSVDKEIGKSKKYASDVYSVSALKNGEIMYLTDVDPDSAQSNPSGTLYIGEEKIEKDVHPWYVMETEDGKIIYFLTDIEEAEGTLCCYKNGKVEEIADDVCPEFVLTKEGGVLYLTDYDIEDHEGTLYYSVDGKEGEEIDDDVAMIVTPRNYEYFD